MTRPTVTRARMGVFAAVAAIGVATGSAVMGPSAFADPNSPSNPTPSTNEAPASSANQSPASSANQSPASSANEAPATSANETPASSANQSPASSANETPAAAADGDCNAAALAKTSASVNTALADYLTKHPDTNSALIEITRQPAFVAVGQMDSYFNEHPTEANAIRGIQAPLNAFKDRCGLQVSPTDALAALASL
ncbi:hypothetical protein MINS_00170 [Mycolicibacterium insubricum]|uniref:hemophore-related protein n=1 Tax=Mycolicibacterium insubricum TaxID=444597 RepID=UPI00138DC075|nr:hemophore-related protein [Mycolicibacterium insubricum]BBZ64588.1 hypothetical protein MINS_00170 [Mycolicibacterium insubricum]